MKIFALACVILLLCSACTTLPENQTAKEIQATRAATDAARQNETNTALKTYSLAQAAISKGDFAEAEQKFSTLIQEFPNNTRIPNALLGKGYALYKLGDNDGAAHITKTFIDSYKKHPLLDYAYYLTGLASYNAGIEHLQNNELVSNNRPILAREAFGSFLHLVRNYPNSRYFEDSRLRMEVLFNKLAEYELTQAKNSLEQEKNHDAIARAEYIIKHYMDTNAAQEAYAVMISAYEAQGDLAAAESLRQQFAQKFSPQQQLTDFGQGG